jgi:sensor histidine kinase regulating citrate/malate metabolism
VDTTPGATAAAAPEVAAAAATPPDQITIRVPLKVKLSLLITALVVLAVALVGLFLLRQQQQSLTAEMTKRGLTMAENFAAGAKTPLLTNDELTLGVLVTDAMKDPDVAYVIVSDQDGNVLATSDARAVKTAVVRPKELEPLKSRVLVQTYKTPQGSIIDYAVPLV